MLEMSWLLIYIYIYSPCFWCKLLLINFTCWQHYNCYISKVKINISNKEYYVTVKIWSDKFKGGVFTNRSIMVFIKYQEYLLYKITAKFSISVYNILCGTQYQDNWHTQVIFCSHNPPKYHSVSHYSRLINSVLHSDKADKYPP